MSNIRYISKATNDGWLEVRRWSEREPLGTKVALPEFLKVELTSTQGGREYFTVLEGIERNNRFSVVKDEYGWLRSGNPGYRGAAKLKFSISDEILTFPGGGKVRAFTDLYNPIHPGPHPVQIPDFPHGRGEHYMSESRRAKTWFYLGEGHAVKGSNDRYLHPGVGSAGCITVDPYEWTDLYDYLIISRSGDAETVGSVDVVS